jgi:hypothetical protein
MLNLAERLLARITDPTRAAAIFGDLLELAATRGRLWFWTAYTRTLISLGWRTPAAFLIALTSVRIMVFVYPRWVHHVLRHLTGEWPVSMFLGQLAVAFGPLLNAIAMCLWFALPYAWMRFGLRDRLTQFACVLFFCTLPVFSFQMWLIDLSSILTMLAVDHQRFITFSPTKGVGWLTTAFALSVAAIVCSRLHRWLLKPPAPSDRTIA